MARKKKDEGKTYRFRNGARVSGVKPETVAKELERIQRKHGGVEPRKVVNEARPDEAPLHPAFEWDDSKAAEAHREWQARHIIRSVVVVTEERPEPEPLMVSVTTGAPDGGRCYQPTEIVVQRPDLYAEAVAEASLRVTAARDALAALRRMATSQPEQDALRLARIEIAMRAMETARQAVIALH